jgi:hypothetical protein
MPSIVRSAGVNLVMSPTELQALDDWRSDQPGNPSHIVATRYLIEVGIKAPADWKVLYQRLMEVGRASRAPPPEGDSGDGFARAEARAMDTNPQRSISRHAKPAG